jgi:hypothetical protein
MKLVGMCAALLCACVMTGCVTDQVVGVPPTLQQSNLVADHNLQERMVTSLIQKADLSREVLALDPSKWRVVADAGLFEVDVQCDRYLAALFTFNRDQRAGRQVLTAAGAGTAAIMGLTGAAGAAIAITAAAFGMATTVFDAGAGSVLFTVSPVAVRSVANRGRQAFLEGIKWEQVNSRPRMMMVVQGYLSQCTPAAIEANIDNAATGAPSVSNLATALQAAALASPSSSVVQNPNVFTASPVAPPAKEPVPVPKVDLPINATIAEQEFIRSRTEAIALQNALGTSPDGDLGPAGVTPLRANSTRLAISEYNTGLLRLAGQPGSGRDVMDGKRRIFVALIGRGSLATSGVKSPFERALLGDHPSCFTIRGMIDAVKGPVITETDPVKCMEILRGAIDARRKELNMLEPAGVLDSNLYDKRPPKPVVIDRPPPEGATK